MPSLITVPRRFAPSASLSIRSGRRGLGELALTLSRHRKGAANFVVINSHRWPLSLSHRATVETFGGVLVGVWGGEGSE